MRAVVIGAGIIGLHVARFLCEKSYEVFLLEKESSLGEHTSGRNSGVIHAGIFYRSGSLKEKSCIDGNRLTYEWAGRLGVAHFPCGKWVVPSNGDETALEVFHERIRTLPIPVPLLKKGDQLAAEEPLLRPTAAVYIPSTGIIDGAAYLKALSLYVEQKGVVLLHHCCVEACGPDRVETSRGEMEFDIAFNCAGLECASIAEKAGLCGYEIRPCRGDYYVTRKLPLRRPVYHLPQKGAHGLGLHITPTVDGQVLIGPNAFFIDGKEDYRHRSAPEDFHRSLQSFLESPHNIPLFEAYSGNRPKLFHEGNPVDDFVVTRRGNWIHFLGIESPGLTAAPSLANSLENIL